MKIKALYLALACAALLPFIPSELSAGAPLKISFQGRLDEGGVPAEGAKNFVFTLHDAVSGGNLVWTGDSQAVTLANGVFNATLSGGTPALSSAAFSGARYIEITVDGVPLLPRQEMVSAPYALVAQSLVSSQTFTGVNTFTSSAAFTAQYASDPGVRISSGLVVAAGRTGIGTASPNSVLSVNGAMSLPVRIVTSDYAITDQDSTILVDASGGNVNVVLPPAAGVTGRVYTVKRIDQDPLMTTVTLGAYGWDIPLTETIEGNDNMDLSGQFQYATVQSGGMLDYDGDATATPTWVILANN
ncbi:MAG: hypothetical protein AB7V08_05500 [Elusimicrobiales bacterium]